MLLPHDPYVFRADGTIIPETASRASDEAELYAGQLAFANGQIKDLSYAFRDVTKQLNSTR